MSQLGHREILERLVAFRTVSSETNLALVDWIERYLVSHGVRCFRHHSDDGSKAALIAHAGPWMPGGVVLSGHSDVVPVVGQDWTSDPWAATEREGRIYGRGTCDMKGFVSLSIWALAEAQNHALRRPLQLALSFDEEVGCTGAPPMIARMQAVVPKATAVIVGEPSRMKPIVGTKGGFGYRVHVHGYEVHSSLLPEGVSAVMEAARIVQWLNDRNAELMAATPTPVAGMFHPPFTTLHVGMIAGGTANNITAADCRFAIDIRTTPDDDIAGHEAALFAEVMRLDAALKQRHPQAGVEIERFFAVPGLRPENEGEAEGLIRALTGENDTGVVSYGAEAGQFQEAGYSVVICGPGDIAQAHQPDEYVEIRQLDLCKSMLERLIQSLC